MSSQSSSDRGRRSASKKQKTADSDNSQTEPSSQTSDNALSSSQEGSRRRSTRHIAAEETIFLQNTSSPPIQTSSPLGVAPRKRQQQQIDEIVVDVNDIIAEYAMVANSFPASSSSSSFVAGTSLASSVRQPIQVGELFTVNFSSENIDMEALFVKWVRNNNKIDNLKVDSADFCQQFMDAYLNDNEKVTKAQFFKSKQISVLRYINFINDSKYVQPPTGYRQQKPIRIDEHWTAKQEEEFLQLKQAKYKQIDRQIDVLIPSS